MPNKKLHKKAQGIETIILITAILLIIFIAGVFTFIINIKSEKLKQTIETSNSNLQKKILLLDLLKSNVAFDHRQVSAAEAVNILMYLESNQKTKKDVLAEQKLLLAREVNNILGNFNGYNADKKVWQIIISNVTKSTNKEKNILLLSQRDIVPDGNTLGLDKETIEASLDFPSLDENLEYKLTIKLITLED